MTDEWLFLVNADECPPGLGMELVTHGRVIALFRVDDEFHALEGVCPHQGGPLGKGSLQGCVVTCPWHGWQFDVRNGICKLSPAIRQPVIEVRAVDGRVYAKLKQT
jgi:nitrite reductase/ring-hydroxylating ferredoxin subunit